MSEEQPRRRRRVARARPEDDVAETHGADGALETRDPTDDAVTAVPGEVAQPRASEPAGAVPATAVPTVVVPTSGAAGLLHRVKVDPAIGLGLFVPGLFVMALGGAMTWHWIFNIGSGVMLLGMAYFVVAVALTALQQRAVRRSIATGATPVRPARRAAPVAEGAAAAET